MKKTKPKRFTNEFKTKVNGLIPSTIKYWLDTRDKDGKLKEDRRKTHSCRLKKEPTIDDYKERYEILKKY